MGLTSRGGATLKHINGTHHQAKLPNTLIIYVVAIKQYWVGVR